MDYLRKSVFSLLVNRLNYTLFTDSMFLLAYRYWTMHRHDLCVQCPQVAPVIMSTGTAALSHR